MPLAPRILYVDDDLSDCEMMAYWLREECGYDVTAAVDGKQAIDLIKSEYFDLFLLDYCLPDMTAVALCELIREVNREAAIMIYSALDREIDKQRAFASGANYYLIKPEQLFEIKPQIDRLLRTLQSPPAVPEIEHRTVVHTVPPHRVRSRGIV